MRPHKAMQSDHRLAALQARVVELEQLLQQYQQATLAQVPSTPARTDQQARIFADITLKVRESLRLDEILNTTVTEIQQFLQADRVVMYQIPPHGVGHVVAEAVVPNIPPMVGLDIMDSCFTAQYVDRYRQGRVRTIDDIDHSDIQPCHAEMLKQFAVRANLVVPILIGHSPDADRSSPNNYPRLWGLLIAHQCQPRQWLVSEVELMVQLANQVGIALGRAELVEALRKSEESRRLALEFSNTGSWDWNMATGQVLWNNHHFRMLGYEVGEVKPSYEVWRDRIHPADRAEVEQLITEALANHRDFDTEYRVVHPDGSVHWLVGRGRGVYDEENLPIRMVGVTLDITPRKRAQLALQQLNEQLDQRIQERTAQLHQLTLELQAEIEERRQVEAALRHSEEKFRLLFDSSPVGKALFSLDKRFLMVNSTFCQLTGYSHEELMGMSVTQITYHDDRSLEQDAIDRLLQGTDTIVKFEKRYITKQGDLLWVNITETLFKAADGSPQHFLRAIEDISDRKQQELAAQQQADRDHLLYTITQRIRQTLDLDDILQTAVDEVKETFQADRVLIFRMQPNRTNVVLKETVQPGYPSCIAMGWAEEQFLPECYNYYLQGKPRIVANVLQDEWSGCIADFMGEMRVQSKIVAPITQTQEDGSTGIWGLLIVHACAELRQWQPHEADFLQQIADQLAIAIQQANLYQQAQQELQERQQAEQALRDSEARYRAIVEDQTELITRYLPDTTLTFVNPAYCRYFGGTPEGFLRKPFLSLIPEEEHHQVHQTIQALLSGESVVTTEHRVVLPTGEIRWQQWTDRAIFNDRGELVELQGVGRDITDRKQAEDSIRASLREKEVLLKEVHHRVKNNLQMVSSLLSLQAGIVQNDQVTEAFVESQRRIKVMALVHEKLYRSENLDQIDFADYVQELVYDLFQSYMGGSSDIALDVNIARVNFSVDTAVTCGLIINELVSNAVKYAFPQGRTGTITVHFTRLHPESSDSVVDEYLSNTPDDSPRTLQYRLVVGDNGVGIPETVDIRNTESLGLQLVCALTQELAGVIELDRSTGTRFTICF
ncbi:MAG: PAS domain S-box protein [Cyanobacteria bacterium]|nr:PAS domain S-box protein [Cyanobacteriota bacterium]MDW8199650.1 PAS domain S-box protein [Cyanobacteriota bacterium SKYGB_h_bin112]